MLNGKKLADDMNDFLWEVIKNQTLNWREPCRAFFFEGLILKEVMNNKPV